MPKLQISIEERIVELLEKNLIISLYLQGANRDQIKEIVGIGTQKVDSIITNLKKIKENKK
ncbi:MAG: hypothetical protein HYZ10_03815 [Ignavibacteriales bacterium]|nr:hypothetical protein [Ignavibacteriales bacterium]